MVRMTLPRLSGAPLVLTRLAAEKPLSARLVREVLKRALGIDALAKLPETMRAELPADLRPFRARPEKAPRLGNAPLPRSSWPRQTSHFVEAYLARRTTPRAVAERALAQMDRLSRLRPSMNVVAAVDPAMVLADAQASTERYERGAPFGHLDGVPLLVKDQHDVKGLPTGLGAPQWAREVASADATIVARLRQRGAIVLAKTVLTEWALSTLGTNAHLKMPHNPYDSSRAAGGSSTGSAVGVALGLCPLATAGDGGGSIRVPASFNGIFGLKPTAGRVSRTGDRFHESVAVVGPLSTSTTDLARFLDAVAATPDPDDELTTWAPPIPSGGFVAALGADVTGLCIGIDEGEWRDASADIAAVGREALRALEKRGAKLVSVNVPLAPHAAKIGYLSIGAEGLTYGRKDWLEKRDLLGEDLRLALAALAGITAVEYLDAQRLRQALRLQMRDVLRQVDVLALPCTAIGAPRYAEEDEGRPFTDPSALDGLCRYAFLANVTGLPAASAPVGTDATGLPIGLQIVGDAWDEATVLAILAELEREGTARVLRAPLAVDLLDV
jgi:aspartyl-tRNA(Asn)/glutamyl-tRNA(Gln) amidotransferase subunit A